MQFGDGNDHKPLWQTLMMLMVIMIIFRVDTFNCGILVAEVGGSGDPRRKWECERGRYLNI